MILVERGKIHGSCIRWSAACLFWSRWMAASLSTRGGGGGVIAAPVMYGSSINCCGGQGARSGAKAGEDNKAADLGGTLEVGV